MCVSGVKHTGCVHVYCLPCPNPHPLSTPSSTNRMKCVARGVYVIICVVFPTYGWSGYGLLVGHVMRPRVLDPGCVGCSDDESANECDGIDASADAAAAAVGGCWLLLL